MISQNEKNRLEKVSNVSLHCAKSNPISTKYFFKLAQRLL
jgi:hypothetical protein